MSRRPLLVVLTAVTAMLVSTAVAAAAPPGVDPATVDLTLAAGQSTTVLKNVTTSTVPPNPDLVLLADTTGSMGGPIGNVRSNANAITGDVLAAQPTAQFGVAEYKDFTDSVPFKVNQGITGDTTAVQAGINQWVASGGGDTPEANLNALYQLATGAVSFRPDGTRIVAWFGDAPSHDPSGGHTLAQTIAALQAAKIRVVAVNVGALDATGQASAITSATGGVLLNNVPAGQVSQAILDGIRAIEVTVTPKVTSCDPQLTVTNDPGSVKVASGGVAQFTETITASAGAAPGTYHCVVDYQVDGVSLGYLETTTVRVLGLSVDDVTVGEGSGGAPVPATFTVSLLGGPAPNPVTVQYATANGTATAPADYAPASGTVTFAPGETAKPVTVLVNPDTVDEPNETFTVNLSAPSGAGLVDPVGVGTILDDDRDGVFSCTGTAANVLGVTAARANPANLPCADDASTVAAATLNAGLIKVDTQVLSASTDLTPDDQSAAPAAGDRALATARIDKTVISTVGLTIELGVIQSQATATCQPTPGGLAPVLAGSSHVASLKINGSAVTVGSAPLTIPLVIGSLKLNGQSVSNGVVKQQAVALDTALATIVLAESQADVHGTAAHPAGNPCRR
ncbi:Calx-beta domain-containing protein [Amycolatopsis regifaucium]|uniref:Hyalin n=1 Tax=Amycolatopsis regifaucium TaxID=546365 RepID=A0A154M3K3_9PSEU|nr:Calx-beta domain-containing protein [Amycolatopsis regifaucium]KZB79146.1 hyalin [Amycolatopsis regifaucium]OKA07330.1 hyalin [Amycolatopsis regifaucium]SFH14181.1 von Willebrand factor type A domain-containing protein [Amycolatopsis regifaucium]